MLTEATGCSAKVVDGSVVLTFDKPEAKPYTYTINVADTDATVDPQPGDMFNYQLLIRMYFLRIHQLSILHSQLMTVL